MIFNRSNSLEVLLLKEGKRYINGGKKILLEKKHQEKIKIKTHHFKK